MNVFRGIRGGEGLQQMNADGADKIAQLLDKHGGALLLLAKQHCSQPEDVLQEAFIAFIRAAPPPDNPVAWLYRVVRNIAQNAARSAGRRRHHEKNHAVGRATWFMSSPHDRIDAAEATQLLDNMPLEQREIVVARIWGGLSFDEIAQITDTPASTVHRHYHQALKTIKQGLGVNNHE